jgi:hypothetical protein
MYMLVCTQQGAEQSTQQSNLKEWFIAILQPRNMSNSASTAVTEAQTKQYGDTHLALALLLVILPATDMQHDVRKQLPPVGLVQYLQSTSIAAQMLTLARLSSSTLDSTTAATDSNTSDSTVFSVDSIASLALDALKRLTTHCCELVWPCMRHTLLPQLITTQQAVNSGSSSASDTAPATVTARAAAVSQHSRVRDYTVLSQIIQSMSTAALVQHAAVLMPLALRGAVDEHSTVRAAMSGLFAKLSRAVTVAPTTITAHSQATAQAAAADTTDDALSRSGALIIRHLVHGEPLVKLSKADLPQQLLACLPSEFDLRPYQWEGVTWLQFLASTGTSGVLADEMGLGKTLQALMAAAVNRCNRCVCVQTLSLM